MQARALMLVASMKKNGNYKETEEEPFTANMGWFHQFRIQPKLVDVKLLVKLRHR